MSHLQSCPDNRVWRREVDRIGSKCRLQLREEVDGTPATL